MSNAIMTAPLHPERVKNLAALLEGIATGVPASLEISDLSLNSHAVTAGGAFIALSGARTHGLSFVHEAIAAGVLAVLWEPKDGVAPDLPDHIFALGIPDLARHLGQIADRFFDEPSRHQRISAVTGTNGKTTTAFMLAAALEQLGFQSAYAGTLGYGRIAEVHSRPHTTPDCISVHRELAELSAAGVRCIGMEVTSHALEQHRVAGVRFESAIFTNLTRDHLDYHGTIEAYGAAKARLFAWPTLQHAIINIDDDFGRSLAMQSRRAALTVYGREMSVSAFTGNASNARYVCATNVATTPVGLDLDLDSSWGRGRMHSRLIGAFNVDNVLAVLASLLNSDVALTDAIAAVERSLPPPGRMEMLTSPGKPLVIVDYAHTPDALQKALQALRKHCSGQLWCVFGCGGERDIGKRPLMGAIAEANSDAVIVTDDNPRGEDGDVIVAGIVSGMQAPERALIERDRARAIELAISRASVRDAVLIAGKGHEDYQIIAGVKRDFSDRDVALAALGRHA